MKSPGRKIFWRLEEVQGWIDAGRPPVDIWDEIRDERMQMIA